VTASSTAPRGLPASTPSSSGWPSR
jgi:hypothetical protein